MPSVSEAQLASTRAGARGALGGGRAVRHTSSALHADSPTAFRARSLFTQTRVTVRHASHQLVKLGNSVERVRGRRRYGKLSAD